MLDRRDFLAVTEAGLLAAAQPKADKRREAENLYDRLTTPNSIAHFKRVVTTHPMRHLLGFPKSGELVERCLHPISPDRVVVLPGDCIHRSPKTHLEIQRVKQIIRKELTNDYSGCGCVDQMLAPDSFETGKLHLLVWFTRIVADYYRPSFQFAKIASKFAVFEALFIYGGWGTGFAFPERLGHHDRLPLRNPPVDWWLCLWPEGLDYCDGVDSKVYTMVNFFLPYEKRRLWRQKYHALVLRQEFMKLSGPAGAKLLSQLDRTQAAQALNILFARALDGYNGWHRF